MIQKQLAIFLAILIATGTVTAPAQERTIISVAAEEVRVDVLVTENGKPMLDLTAADFEVLDNGVTQEIQYAEPLQQMPISAILVFDMSGSVAGVKLDRLREAANGFLADLKKEDRVALVTFNHSVVLGSPLINDIARVKQALEQTQSSGDSSLIDASYAGLVLAESGSELPFLIIFSDDLDTYSWLTEEAVIETAKRSDAVVYAVSTGRLPNKSFLRDLAKFTGGFLFEVGLVDNLPAVFLQILDEFRQRYLVTYIPTGVSDSGWHKLEVRVKDRKAKVRARPGYMRNPPADVMAD